MDGTQLGRRRWWWLALSAVAVVGTVALGLALAGGDGSRTAVSAGRGASVSSAGSGTDAGAPLPTNGPPSTLSPAPPLGTINVQPGAPGEPVLVAAVADAIEGTITLTFDVPVVPAGDVARHMSLTTHNNDASCAMPQGNAHNYLTGAGTPTITFSASSLMPGTSYISMGSGVVLNAATGQANVPVGCTAVDAGAPAPPQLLRVSGDASAGSPSVRLVFDRQVANADAAQLAVFDDAACTLLAGGGTGFLHEPYGGPRDESADPTVPAPERQSSTVDVAATGLHVGIEFVQIGAGVVVEPFGNHANEPSGCLQVSVSAAPVLVSVHGTMGTLTLTFDQPVEPVAPNPTQPPAAGSEGLNTMYLTVFSADSACSRPNGNAHYFISGMGTTTVTVEATSIVAPTTYIRIAEGFVKSVADGTYNRAVACTAVPITS